MIDHHVRTPVIRVVVRVDITKAHGCSFGPGIAPGLDIAQVIAYKQYAGRVKVEHFAGQNQRLGVRRP